MSPTQASRRFQFTRAAALALLAALAAAPGPARAWWNDEWTGRKPLHVDLGPAGVAVPVSGAVALVRLHAGNFKFEVAKEDGSDLRFVAADDKTPLKFHLEKFDGLLGEALAWVALPELPAGAKTDLWLYYGNPKAPSAEDPKGTYDPATALVYHFGEQGQPPRDSSISAIQAAGTALPSDGGLIGRDLKLDGATALTIPASAALAWTAGGQMTWSVWVKPAGAEAGGVLYARRDGARAFLVGFDGGRPYLEVQDGGEPRRAAATAALPAGGWHHLAVTAADGLTLYVDGKAAALLATPLPALDSGATLGGDPGAPAAPPPAKAAKGAKGAAAPEAARTSFQGEVDELQVAKVARGAAFLQLAAVTQGTDPGQVLTAGPDEAGGSSGGGYFAVILRSVTLDGWVVIGILAIMAVVSWAVMVTKAGYLGAVEKANDRFTEAFQAHSADLPRLVGASNGTTPLGDAAALRDSPLYRIFQIAAGEIRKRSDGHAALHAEAIEAIRASLDAGMVRENQRLAKRLVLLTIAISGGPFLGLLGTVVGVMITFAAIAAAGEVNVNAIAPGIAAALVATVAGLGVAIPALFGYNWLLTRSKEATATMQVFVDELVARVAESYSERAIQQRGRPASVPVAVE